MKKEITFNDVSRMFRVLQGWRDYSKDIKLNSVSLYKLISLKKKIEEQEMLIEETIQSIFLRHHAEETQGGLKLPDEEQAAATKELNEFGAQKVEIESASIPLNDGDNVPVELLEALFDFFEC